MPQPPDTFALKPGLRVLVTAGASGIGRAIADLFLNHGARVHICDVSAEFLAEFSTTWPKASVSKADVSSDDDVANLFVMDASFLPSSSAQNPALTIAAQALRVGEKAAFH